MPSSRAELIADFGTGRWTVRHGDGADMTPLRLACLGEHWGVAKLHVEWDE